MKTKAKLGFAALILIAGLAIGEFSYRAWYRAYHAEEDAYRIANIMFGNFLPGQSKETFMLIQLAEGIETRTAAETRRYMCRLIDIKIATMKEAVKRISVPSSPKREEELRAIHYASIPTIDDVVQRAHCPLDSLPNSDGASGTRPEAKLPN
jgi:hypothetical protein